jgi:GlcNAc-P-P-Und epimerase
MSLKEEKILITGGSGFIGTNLVELFEALNYNFINIDKNPPIKKDQAKYWKDVNILDYNKLKNVVEDCKPSIIIHLAARTDTLSNNMSDYSENITGTENLINIVAGAEYIRHIIITSTQYVYKSAKIPFPLKDNDYIPHTVYGESKMLNEEYLRNSSLKCPWTIIRPTNVWGPWHMRYPNELWKIIDKGFYFHPGKKEVIRTYGYVKNVVHQIHEIIKSPKEIMDRQTFYLGDMPIDSAIWLNEFSRRLTNKDIKIFPKFIFKIIALIGDVLRSCKIPFPLYSVRYYNMIEDYYAPTIVAIKQFGLSHPNHKNNVDETIKWLESEGKNFFKYWKNK